MGACGSRTGGDGGATSDRPYNSTEKGPRGILGKGFHDVTIDYNLGVELGKGTFGVVRKATCAKTDESFACKSIAKRRLRTKAEREMIKREVEIQHHLGGHSGIVNIVEAVEDRKHVHLILEECSGGELFDRILSKGIYSEADAAATIRDIVEVVAHCHSLGVVHRDLKPENFLFENSSPGARIKATDFGLSSYFRQGEPLTEMVGSAFYVAPEVLKKSYSKEADIWSCGVILYILLCGAPPYHGSTDDKVFERIKAGQPPSFDYEPWPDISEEAKACVRRMLKHSPSDRATADEILTDPWMQRNGVASDKPLGSAVGDRIRKFVALNKLKREAIRMMAASMAPEEVAGLRELFSAADVNDDGTISVLELRDIMQKPGYAGIGEESSILASVEKLNALLNEADVDGSGNLDLEEFIAATVHTSKLYKEEKLRDTFDKFDVDGSGFLSREEIKAALNERGLNEAGLQGIFEEVDTNNDGKVDYDEFCSLMRAGDPVCSGTGMRSSIRFSFTSD
mmetsp:Transcript_18058/g.56450  ORF Transcript_18058/g.56450 Transcript_18058/m.56450 type:complete len:512 (+) Transcript_18058:129-1664(+)